jgi:hypothetical protein
MEPFMQFLRLVILLPMCLILASCGGSNVPDQQRAGTEAVSRMVAAAKGAHPNGKVVLILPAAVEYQGIAVEETGGRIQEGLEGLPAGRTPAGTQFGFRHQGKSRGTPPLRRHRRHAFRRGGPRRSSPRIPTPASL